MITKVILAAMLALATPGYSNASRVDVGKCDGACADVVKALTGSAPRLDYRGHRGKWRGWTRRETPAEGARRFALIASAIAYVAEHPPGSWASVAGPYPSQDLWRGLVTIGRHESAFWRSIHEGRIRGAAGEWGLFQIHPSVLGSLGVEGEDLVGLDYDSTVRSAAAAAELLGRARRLCPPAPHDEWWAATIAAYGSGQGCAVTNDWVTERVQTYERTAHHHKLPLVGVLGLLSVEGYATDWRPDSLRSELPDVVVTEIRTEHQDTTECGPSEIAPCLRRMGSTELTAELIALAVKVFRLHRLDPYGTEVHLDHHGTELVAKLEVHSDLLRGDHKGLSLFELVDDWCGSGGAQTCGESDARQP